MWGRRTLLISVQRRVVRQDLSAAHQTNTQNGRRRAAVSQSSFAKSKCSNELKSHTALAAVAASALALNFLWKAADCIWLSRSTQNTGYRNVCSRFFVRLWNPWYTRGTLHCLSKKRRDIIHPDFFQERDESSLCFFFTFLFSRVVCAKELQVRTTEIAQIRTANFVTCSALHSFFVPLYPTPLQFLT